MLLVFGGGGCASAGGTKSLGDFSVLLWSKTKVLFFWLGQSQDCMIDDHQYSLSVKEVWITTHQKCPAVNALIWPL